MSSGRVWGSRRLTWAIVLVGISLEAWLVFAKWCPTSLQLERFGLATGGALPSLHGEARCWARFFASAAILVALAVGAELIASRRTRRESRGHGA